MKDYTIRTTCRLCSGPLSEPIFDVGESALANEYVADPNAPQDTFPIYIVECLTCRHVQMPVVVNPERLYARGYTYRSGTSPVYRAHLEAYADEITERCGKNLKILEVGSNDGTFLRMLQSRGHTVVGVDPAGTGEDVICEFFTDSSIDRVMDALGGPADVVVANHVFAHVADLPALAAAIRSTLATDGAFFMEVGFGPFAGIAFDLVYHEHLDYHDPGSLLPFLHNHGLTPTAVTFDGAQGSSMRVRCCQEKVEQIIYPNGMGRMAERFKDSLQLAHNRGPLPTVAFGACAKLTTFCAVTGYEPSKVYDDNDFKVGLYTPGTHRPIVAAREILTDNPPAVLVTAWNFYDEIRARLREWGYRGDIIRALPSWHVDRLETA